MLSLGREPVFFFFFFFVFFFFFFFFREISQYCFVRMVGESMSGLSLCVYLVSSVGSWGVMESFESRKSIRNGKVAYNMPP
jgi:hypothetical protein